MKTSAKTLITFIIAAVLFCTVSAFAEKGGPQPNPDPNMPPRMHPRDRFHQRGPDFPNRPEDMCRPDGENPDGNFPPRPPFMEGMRERIREHTDEYTNWLKENNPEQAKQLEELKQTNPELYREKLRRGMEEHYRFKKNQENNPELAKLMEQSRELRKTQQDLLGQISSATDENQKKELTEKLRGSLSESFDIRLKQKQMRYDDLLKRLENLKQEAEKQKQQLNNLQQEKQNYVNERLDTLLKKSKENEIGWD